MEAHNATTAADSDYDYLDDVVVRAAYERLQREFDDHDSVSMVYCARFEDNEKTDYITVATDSHTGAYSLANIVQEAIDTGSVEVVKIESDAVRFAPSED